MSEKLDAAVAAWNATRDAYESALREGADVEEATQAMFDAELGVLAESDALAKRLNELYSILHGLNESLTAREAILEQRALDAERSAKHYDLAEKGHAEREKLGEIEELRESIQDLTRAFDKVRAELEEL